MTHETTAARASLADLGEGTADASQCASINSGAATGSPAAVGEPGFSLRDILLACRRPRARRHGCRPSRIKSAIINRLRTASGAVVSTKALIASIYGDDPNGGPNCADDCIAVFILRLRADGWPIETVGYQGYRYAWRQHEVTA